MLEAMAIGADIEWKNKVPFSLTFYVYLIRAQFLPYPGLNKVLGFGPELLCDK